MIEQVHLHGGVAQAATGVTLLQQGILVVGFDGEDAVEVEDGLFEDARLYVDVGDAGQGLQAARIQHEDLAVDP